jgi:hypothetical protein
MFPRRIEFSGAVFRDYQAVRRILVELESGNRLFWKGWGLTFNGFILGAQTSCAQVKLFKLAIYQDNCGMDIGPPVPLGMTLGMAHIVTELR